MAGISKIDPSYTVYVMGGKLRLIELSLVYRREEMDDIGMDGICTLLSEIQHDLCEVAEYCHKAEAVLHPLHEPLKQMPKKTDVTLLESMCQIDPDQSIRRRFLQELDWRGMKKRRNAMRRRRDLL